LQRIEDIFETCDIKMVFSSDTFDHIARHCHTRQLKYIHYSDIQTKPVASVPVDIDGESIAYIMFTSGSTGKPKGAAVSHQNIIHFIRWIAGRYNITTQDNFANISPLFFDNSVFDFYGALFNGASLTPINKPLLTQPLALVEYIEKMQCTLWFSVPTMLIYLLTMRVLVKSSLPDIRVFTFGGEGFPKTELKKLYCLYCDRAELINVYGPTECTCICSSYTISLKDFDKMDELPCLGVVNPNVSFVILDDGESSTTGELCLLGPAVSRGYYNDPQATAKAFCVYSDNTHFNKAMYKTGDLVSQVDGLLYFKGRADNQVKHMGYRIELEEIECAINQLSEIAQVVVVYHRATAAFGKIIAFVVPACSDIALVEVKQQLSECLPAYMLPSSIEILKALPKTANGKIDRVALKSRV